MAEPRQGLIIETSDVTQAGDPGGTGERRKDMAVLAVLALISMIGPLSLNIVMPVLPTIQKAFDVPRESATAVLSLFLLGMAVAQLALGPLADRAGRRPVLIGGLLLYVVASAAAGFATSIQYLLIARICQALGATVGLPLARTIIRDLYDREKAASMISYVTMVMVVAPMLSPLLGALVSEQFGWQAIFLVCVCMGITALLAVILFLPETRPSSLHGATSRDVVIRSLGLLKRRAFLTASCTCACASATFFAFQGGAPYLVIDIMSVPVKHYALWFMPIALGYMAGNFISGRFAQQVGIERMMGIGNLLGLVGALTALALAAFPVMHPAALFLPMVVIAFANGLVIANSIAAAVSVDIAAAGAASGLAGFMQSGLSSLASYIVGAIPIATTRPLAFAVTTLAILGLAFYELGRRP